MITNYLSYGFFWNFEKLFSSFTASFLYFSLVWEQIMFSEIHNMPLEMVGEVFINLLNALSEIATKKKIKRMNFMKLSNAWGVFRRFDKAMFNKFEMKTHFFALKSFDMT